MNIDQECDRYISYLLRMWRVRGEGKWVWRASLERPKNGKVEGFPDLESLITYLRREAGEEVNQSRGYPKEDSLKDL